MFVPFDFEFGFFAAFDRFVLAIALFLLIGTTPATLRQSNNQTPAAPVD